MLGVLTAVVIVAGANIAGMLEHIHTALATLGGFLAVAYGARAYVDGRERNPELHRALAERHVATGRNPTPPREGAS